MAPNLMVSNPTVKEKIGSDMVIFASGNARHSEILATGKSLESLSFAPCPGMEDLARESR
jgi:hypothetical protein